MIFSPSLFVCSFAPVNLDLSMPGNEIGDSKIGGWPIFSSVTRGGSSRCPSVRIQGDLSLFCALIWFNWWAWSSIMEGVVD